jgi:hypothetical protein
MTNQYKFAVIIRNFFKTTNSIPLGRWHLDKHTNLKIDLSNEDHCGTCASLYNKPENYTFKDKSINVNNDMYK